MEYLSQRGIPFTEKDVASDLTARRELIEGGYSSIPVILVDGQAIIGFDPKALDAALG
jgi:glutaredoxin 3